MLGSFIILGCSFIAYLFYEYWKLSKRGQNAPKGKKNVPMVEGCLPFIGHGLTFPKDILGFMRKASEKYGKVFRIKIFKTEYVIVCDRTVAQQYFSLNENKFSLHDVLSRLYFDYGFTDNPPTNIQQTVSLNRKSLGVKFDTYYPKMYSEGEMMMEKFKKICANGPITTELSIHMKKFIANTSARCFLDKELSEEAFEDLEEFVRLYNKCLIGSSFLPKWIVYFFSRSKLAQRRKKLIDFFAPILADYRTDLEKNDSFFLRAAVDHVDEKSGKPLTDAEISGVILTLLYVSAENTSAGLTNSLTDLACHPTYWEELRVHCQEYLDNNDIRGLMTSPFLNSCILESSRRTPAIFQITRDPRVKDVVLGDYWIGDTNCVSLCAPLLMFDKYADEIFSNPGIYNPKRFMGEKPEPSSNLDILSWGGGAHLCPGKMFALCETKIAVALMLVNFKVQVDEKKLPPLQFLSSSLYAERKVEAVVSLAKP